MCPCFLVSRVECWFTGLRGLVEHDDAEGGAGYPDCIPGGEAAFPDDKSHNRPSRHLMTKAYQSQFEKTPGWFTP